MSGKYSESAKKSLLKYQKANIQQVKFNFHRQYDADILSFLDSLPNKQGYVKSLIRADMARAKSEKEGTTMTTNTKSISLDNGHTYLTAAEAMPEITARNLWDAIVELMDDDTRETVASEGHDDEGSFLARYLELAPADLIIG